MTSLKILVSFLIVLTLCDYNLAWDNGWDGDMKKDCPSGQSFYRIKSEHHNYYEDRRWEWFCKSRPHAGGTCEWKENVNSYDGVMDFTCPSGSFVAGAESTHSNYYNDRVFSFKCCQAAWPYTCTATNKQTSDFINGFDGNMDWTTTKYIEGFYSVHHNYYEDRKWKVKTVDLTCQKTCACPSLLDSTWNVQSLTYGINTAETAQGKPEVLHTAVFDNTKSLGTGTETFEYTEVKTSTSIYEKSSEVGLTTGFSFEVGVPAVSSSTGFVEVSSSLEQTWGEEHETEKEYKSTSEVEIPAGRAVRMSATVNKGDLNVPFTMTLEKLGCTCVVSGTWYGVTYFDKRTVTEDITDQLTKRSVEERSTKDEVSDDTKCGQGPDGWECKSSIVKFVEFDEFSITSSAVDAANKMAGKTASECFKECQADSKCVGVVRKSSVALGDSDECYSVGQGQIMSGCKPDDATDNEYVVWIEQGRKHDCELPQTP